MNEDEIRKFAVIIPAWQSNPAMFLDLFLSPAHWTRLQAGTGTVVAARARVTGEFTSCAHG